MNYDNNDDTDGIFYGWLVYIMIVFFLITTGFSLDAWYRKKQRTVFQRHPEEYLIN